MQTIDANALVGSVNEQVPSDEFFSPTEVKHLVAKIAQRDIPAQMVYNYIKNGYIEATEYNGRKAIERNEVVRWISKYMSRNSAVTV